MTLAAINYLSISINLLLVVFVFVCFLMTLIILMQRPKQEGLGAAFGAGVTDQVFGARTTNVLQRGTVYLATAFFVLSLALSVMVGIQNRKNSLLVPKTQAKSAPAQPAAEPEKPKSLTEELPEPAPVPVTPATPDSAVPAPAPAPAPAPQAPAPAPAPEAPAPAPESAPAPAPAPSEKPEGQ